MQPESSLPPYSPVGLGSSFHCGAGFYPARGFVTRAHGEGGKGTDGNSGVSRQSRYHDGGRVLTRAGLQPRN
jgi:hypothetical protein